MFFGKFDKIFLVLRGFIIQDGNHIAVAGLDGHNVIFVLRAAAYDEKTNRKKNDGGYPLHSGSLKVRKDKNLF